MTNDIISANAETNSMYACNNYASNGLNNSMFFNATGSIKANNQVLCANSPNNNNHLNSINGYTNGILNRISPAYFDRVSFFFF